MTMTVPKQQHLIFEASTPAEFRALLSKILEQSPLSCGQIAVKTGMPRSTAYSLPDVKRVGLPSNPRQVQDFVQACGLGPLQIDRVMDLWAKINIEILNAKAKAEENKDNTGSSGTGTLERGSLSAPSTMQVGEHYPDSWSAKGNPFRQASTWPDVLHYVLASEERARRATLLLLPLALVVLGSVCALVFLAVEVRSVAPFVVGGLLAPFAVYAFRHRKRRTKTDK